MRYRRLLAIPAAVAIALMAGSTAMAAWPPGSVTVDTNGCEFTIHVDLDGQPAIIGWEVREYAATPLDGTLVLSGFDNPDAEGRLTVGPQAIAPGHYNAIVDDETPVDASSNVVDFTLACETPTPTPTPTPTGSELPTATASQGSPPPTGEELPVEGTPPPGGGVLGLTPPPTDTGSPTAATGSVMPMLLAGVLVFAAGILAFVTRRTPRTMPVHVRRRRD